MHRLIFVWLMGLLRLKIRSANYFKYLSFNVSMPTKLRIGWFSFTCCEDSTIVFTELMNDNFFKWKNLMEFKYFRTLKGKNDYTDLDLAFVEGAISNDMELKFLKDIRKNSKKLVAIGSCACTGSPANQRNFFEESTKNEISHILDRFGLYTKVSPISEFVNVDDFISGCPMDENLFLSRLDRYLKEFGLIKNA